MVDQSLEWTRGTVSQADSVVTELFGLQEPKDHKYRPHRVLEAHLLSRDGYWSIAGQALSGPASWRGLRFQVRFVDSGHSQWVGMSPTRIEQVVDDLWAELADAPLPAEPKKH